METAIDQTTDELKEETSTKCVPGVPPVDGSLTGMECTGCVCAYRNQRVQKTVDDIQGMLSMARDEADLIFSKDITKEIHELQKDKITPWTTTTSCIPLFQ